jgi:hypothetical protein
MTAARCARVRLILIVPYGERGNPS